MRTRCIPAGAALWLVSATAGLAATQPAGPYPTAPAAYGAAPAFDARYVRDLYWISDLVAASAKTHPLAFCAVHPNPNSGYSIGHATYDRKHNTYIDNGLQEQASDFGTFNVFGSLSGVGFPASGTYRWPSRQGVIYANYNVAEPPDPDYYSIGTDPFQAGGIAVLSLPIAKRLTKNPFQYAVPRACVELIEEEARLTKEQSSLFCVPRTDNHLQAVRDLLKSPNPLLSLEATRLLVKAGQLRPSEAADLVRVGSDLRRALETAAILCSLPEEQRNTVGAAVLEAIKSLKRSSALRPVVVGATVAEHVCYDRQDTARFATARYARSVALEACDLQKKLDPHGRADDYAAFLMQDP